MYEPKREYNLVKEKREDKPPPKRIYCVNCGKPIAREGTIQIGRVVIDCNSCGVTNTIEAIPKKLNDESRQNQGK